MRHLPRMVRLLGCISLLLCKHTVVAQEVNATFANPVHFYEKCAPYQGDVKTSVRLSAWRGERISQALILWSGGPGIHDITIRVPPIISGGDTISPEAILLRSVGYVRADLESRPCGGYEHRDPAHFIRLGDILIDQTVSTLGPDCPEVYWLTIDVPGTCMPGLYEGKVEVWHADRIARQLSLTVDVSELRLPPVSEWKFHLDFWQYPTAVVDRYNETHPGDEIAYWDADHFALLQKMYRPLAGMGQKVITAHIKEGALGSPSMIEWMLQPDGNWKFDFSVFDAYVQAMTRLGIFRQINCHSPIGWNSDQITYLDMEHGGIQTMEAPIGSGAYKRIWKGFLDSFRMHLIEQGWFHKTVLFLDEVEPGLLDWTIGFIHAHDPDWNIGLAAFRFPPDSVRIHLQDLSLMIGVDGGSGMHDRPEVLTFYTSCNPQHPNHFVAGDADPYENLRVGWYAASNGYNGFLRWAFDNWSVTDPADQQVGAFTSGDFSFLYRSSNNLDMTFYPSVRMELIREGIEDHEKILILKERLNSSGSATHMRLSALLTEKLAAVSGKAGKPHESGEPHESGKLMKDARRLLDEITTSLK